MGGSEIMSPPTMDVAALHKWKLRARKAMLVIKTIVEEMLEHIRKAMMPKEDWNTFMTLFTKVKNGQLQPLENKLILSHVKRHDDQLVVWQDKNSLL